MDTFFKRIIKGAQQMHTLYDNDDFELVGEGFRTDVHKAHIGSTEGARAILANKAVELGNTEKVFVYGTLRKDQSRGDVLPQQKSTYLGIGTLYRYRMVKQGSFPAIFYSDRVINPVEGEIWACSPECMEELDKIEGVKAGLFSRRRLLISGYGLCYLYAQDRPFGTNQMVDAIISGIWKGPATPTVPMNTKSEPHHLPRQYPITPYYPPPYVPPPATPPVYYGKRVSHLLWSAPKAAVPENFEFPFEDGKSYSSDEKVQP